MVAFKARIHQEVCIHVCVCVFSFSVPNCIDFLVLVRMFIFFRLKQQKTLTMNAKLDRVWLED